jgi:hypothetical protein
LATEYTDRAFIMVTANRLNQANNAAKNWDPDVGGDKTFGSLMLSASGNAPVQWYGCDTRLTPAMKAKVDTFKSSNTNNCKYYLESAGWSWESALTDAGLKVIVPAFVP